MSKGAAIKSMVKASYRAALKGGGTLECGICHKPIRYQSDLSLDHILPKQKGGTNQVQNLQPTHHFCNLAKGNRYQHEVEGDQSV